MSVAISAFYAGLLGLVLLALSARVILRRRSHSVSLGFKDDPILERRIRGHGNFTEYVPMALILLVLFENQGGATWAVHLVGLMLFSGRLLHGYALGFSEHSPLRVPGIALTLLAIGLLSFFNLGLALS